MVKRMETRGRPAKPDNRVKNISIHEDVLDAVDDMAIDESRTFSAQVEVLLRDALAAKHRSIPPE